MDPSAFLAPDEQALRRLTLAAGGRLALMTVAPELPRALCLISELVEAGVELIAASPQFAPEGVQLARDRFESVMRLS